MRLEQVAAGSRVWSASLPSPRRRSPKPPRSCATCGSIRGTRSTTRRIHYRAPNGELFYKAENDLGVGLESIVVHAGSEPKVSALLGADIWNFVEQERRRRSCRSCSTTRTATARSTAPCAARSRGRPPSSRARRSARWTGRRGAGRWASATRPAPPARPRDDRRYLASVEGEPGARALPARREPAAGLRGAAGDGRRGPRDLPAHRGQALRPRRDGARSRQLTWPTSSS